MEMDPVRDEPQPLPLFPAIPVVFPSMNRHSNHIDHLLRKRSSGSVTALQVSSDHSDWSQCSNRGRCPGVKDSLSS